MSSPTVNDKIGDAIIAIDSTRQYKLTVGDIDSIVWLDGKAPISNADIEAKIAEHDAADAQKVTDKASGKAKLQSGESLTAAETEALFG